MNDKKQRLIAGFIGIVIVLIVGVAFIIEENIRKHTPTKKHIDDTELEEMFMMDGENLPVVLNGEITGDKAYDIDGSIYLEFGFVKEKLNRKFYWDNNENILLYTTPTEVIKADVGKKEYFVNKAKKTTDYAVVKTDGSKVYVAVEFVRQYSDIAWEQNAEPERICVTSDFGDSYSVVTAKKNTQVRVGAGIKKKIVYDVKPEEEMRVLNPDENQPDDWTKVSVANGYIGYVKNSALNDVEEKVDNSDFVKPEYSSISKDFTVCMGWHMVTSEAANNTILDVTANAKGMNVISPTWFRISDNDGNISSLADSSYVQRAHMLGLEVWAMVDDQAKESNDNEVFPYTSKRERLENQLLAAAIESGLDGINIDFEHILDIPEDYLQFLREFSVKCRNNGIVLSVDNYSFMSTQDKYNLEEQGELVDYVIIMGYDEHGVDSKEAGSVASLSFVKTGIENMLKKVPSEKVINAVPFYTRIWSEKGEKLDSRALGMADAWAEMDSAGAETVWVENFGQMYGEYQANGITYRCWLEDAKSAEERAKLIGEYKLAGIACWRLGYETADVWNTIVKYTN